MSGRRVQEGDCREPVGGGTLFIYQNRALPCFSLDACLLAAFCPLPKQGELADLCTGSGIIPLLLHLRQADIRIKALELMPKMAAMAQRSFSENGLQQIRLRQGDVRRAAELLGSGYEVVCCNPPYYPLSKGRVSSDEYKAAARSELYCTLAEVIGSAAELLAAEGSFALSIVWSRREEALSLLCGAGLMPVRELWVRDCEQSDYWLVLIEAQKTLEERACLRESLTVYDEKREYTPQMQTFCSAWAAAWTKEGNKCCI